MSAGRRVRMAEAALLLVSDALAAKVCLDLDRTPAAVAALHATAQRALDPADALSAAPANPHHEHRSRQP